MARAVLTIVICYDVVGAAACRRLAALLEERMVRVQRSVFEARMTAAAANALFDLAAGLIEEEDSLRMYVLSRDGLGKCRAAGGVPLPEEGAFWLL